jgi:hypothetical protein
MLKFFARLLILGALVVSTMTLILILHTSYNTYLESTVDKRRILDATVPPRIIFVGGSNLALGLDSEMIQAQTGTNVVNMGVHAALGLRYMIEQVKGNISPGDVIVVVPEYEQFSSLMNGDAHLADLVVLDPASLKYIRPQQYSVLLRYAPMPAQYAVTRKLSDLLHRPTQDTGDIYNRESFNKQGDLLSHLDKPNKQDWQKKLANPTIDVEFDAEAIAMLNEFESYVTGRGAKAFLIFPPVPEVLHAKDKKFIENVYQQLKMRSQLPVLSAPGNYFLPLPLFYDNVYHLNSEGRRIRTEKVLSDLKPVLPNGPSIDLKADNQ